VPLSIIMYINGNKYDQSKSDALYVQRIWGAKDFIDDMTFKYRYKLVHEQIRMQVLVQTRVSSFTCKIHTS